MNRRPDHDVARAVRDGDALDRAMVAARRRVIRLHRFLGVPLVIWRDGKIAEVDPESVELPDEEPRTQPPEHEL